MTKIDQINEINETDQTHEIDQINATESMNPQSAINPRNAKNKLALIALLTLPLLIIWLLSLRSVRLKIGDYYFNQGNFDHAVNWYEKVVRKENQRIHKGKTNGLQLEYDLSKFKSALIPLLEQSLIKACLLLCFEPTKDLKILMNQRLNEVAAQRVYDSLMQQLSKHYDSINSEPREKLQKAKKELNNFDIFENYRNLFKKKHEPEELEYLASISNFFKDILLADEYFYQSPLNWVKAKDLYESQVRSGKVNNVDLFLKLGYIHAKFCNFNDSYKYFQKACDLLNDANLKKIVDHLKNKKAFLYPDDMMLLPKKILNYFPFLQDMSFFETKNLLNILKIQVRARSDGLIGKTGVKSPVDIIIRSAGYLVGNTQIVINGENISQIRRGYNIVVLNPQTGKVEKSEGFDTCGSKEDVKKMINFINGTEKGKIVCVTVADDAAISLSGSDGKIFEKIGAKRNLHGKFRWAHGIIGVKGSRRGEAIEAMSEKPVEIYVITQKL